LFINTNPFLNSFTYNIPFLYSTKSNESFFDFVEIKHRDGKSRGCGLIKFSTPDQAMKAVELFNGSRFEGRTLEVKLDQLDK
jgi:heterogeneous nuclear ribonucleoprotein M